MQTIDIRNLPNKNSITKVVFGDSSLGYIGQAFEHEPQSGRVTLTDGGDNTSLFYISKSDLNNAIKALEHIRDNLV